MQQFKVGPRFIPVWYETVDGEEVYVVNSQQSDDGGLVTTTFVDDGTGVLKSFQSWRGVGEGADVTTREGGRTDAESFSLTAPTAELSLRRAIAKRRANAHGFNKSHPDYAQWKADLDALAAMESTRNA